MPSYSQRSESVRWQCPLSPSKSDRVLQAERNTMRSAKLVESAPRREANFRLLGGLFLLALLAIPAWTQQSQLRTVRGAVLDKAENPMDSAVVYLKNVRTLAVKTYISDKSAESGRRERGARLSTGGKPTKRTTAGSSSMVGLRAARGTWRCTAWRFCDRV